MEELALAGVEDIPKDLNLFYGHNHVKIITISFDTNQVNAASLIPTCNQHMYGGPKAHVLHFPVAKQKLLNIVAFVNDPTDWPLGQPMSEPATKDEVAVVFSDWGPTVRSELDKWAVFHAMDHPPLPIPVRESVLRVMLPTLFLRTMVQVQGSGLKMLSLCVNSWTGFRRTA